jgi:carboxyl-terminal processing protease
MFTISTFQFGLDSLFSKAVQSALDKWYTKYIIDLRNNPWWSLEDVEQMLNYFVPSGQPSVIVKSNMREEPYLSQGVATGLSLQNKNIVILINKWSASASEILTAVIREYGSQVIVLGETSFGKWSVQSIRDYADGSNIKITIAKWLTWKNKTSIDTIGVKPDKEIIDDPKTTQDEVLDYAKML